MFSIPSNWELASLVCKFLLYIGTASIAGGTLCLWQFSDGRRETVSKSLAYIALGSLFGFQAVALNFLLQIGLINDRGISGMFDWNMGSILLDTQLGDVTLFRLVGFAFATIASLLFLRKANQLQKPPGKNFYRFLLRVNTLPLMFLLISFRLAGHVSILSLTAKVAIFMHVLAVTAWVGALYPLLILTQTQDIKFLRLTMQRFGNVAMGILSVLVVSGVLMLLQLVPTLQELFGTAYGRSVLFKLSLVMLVLGLAALHKWVLVPRLITLESALKLRVSIQLEMVLLSLILITTTYLSTVIGPAGH